MKIFSFFFGKVERIALAILGTFSLFLLGRNSRLSKKNEELNNANIGQNKTIEIQKKVIDVAKNRKRTDLNGMLKRMRQDKL
jgi:hypothetical protein